MFSAVPLISSVACLDIPATAEIVKPSNAVLTENTDDRLWCMMECEVTTSLIVFDSLSDFQFPEICLSFLVQKRKIVFAY